MPLLIAIASFFLLFPCQASSSERAFPHYELVLSFDINASRLMGDASMTVEPDTTLQFQTPGLTINRVTLNNAPLEHIIKSDNLMITAPSQGVLTISYEAEFKGGTAATGNSIDSRGIFLSGNWYPKKDGLAPYRLRAILPRGYQAVSESEQIETTTKPDGTEFLFLFDHPRDTISFVAARGYEILKDRANGVEFYAYFFPANRGRARASLQEVKKHIELYQALLTPYPYKRFSLVEHFLPAGYSAPTFALLGEDVLHRASSQTVLRGEVLRQWFGNSVFINTQQGNWAEGLTNYFADQLYEEQADRGWEYRKQLLIDYAAYVNSGNEISLREFKDGSDRAARAVGYGKASLVFHMLKKSLGEELFHKGIRTFITGNLYRRASWDDLKAAFEKESARDLSPFFMQWLNQKGLPELRYDNAKAVRKGAFFQVSFDLLQKTTPFNLDLPSVISSTEGGTSKELLRTETEKKSVTLALSDEPRTVVIDNDYDIARKLTPGESPPVLATLLGEKQHLIVLPVSNSEAYGKITASLKEQGGSEKNPVGLKDEEFRGSSVVVLGKDNPLVDRLFGKIETGKAGFNLIVKKNPWNPLKVIVLIDARSAGEAEAALPRLTEYDRYGTLAFDQGRIVLKTTEDSGRGLEMELRAPAAAIDLSALKTLDDVIENSSDKKIIYVGEQHDKYAHHAIQLQVIKSMYRKNSKLAIGMEMFQRPFQKVLDDYINGLIDERAFLKQTEYFKRWVFDYNLYKPILDFARARKIPVVALNQRKEIIEKVSKKGLDSLGDEDRKEVPQQLDLSDEDYRERLKTIFEQHKGSMERSFDFFYQAQVLWDETMAFSIDEFLKKNPDHRMVVIAGGGHLAYGSGIPKRSFRRNNLPYFIILSDGDLDRDIAHYLVLPEPLEGANAPRLMAALKAENGRVSVIDMPKDSVSKRAGIRAGDVILSLDNEQVENVEDVRLLLFYKQKGETVKAKVLRRGFFGPKEILIHVML